VTKTIFISYRRQDTAPAAGRVYDRLSRLLTSRHVFFDVSAIAGGEDFVSKVTTAIQKSDAVLVFIGKRWLEPTAEGIVRIREPGDHVRAEVHAALQNAPVVLPVLVDGAVMPQPEQLPEDIRAIATKNALPLRHETFDDDTENIISALLGARKKERLWEDRGKLSTKLAYALAGLVAGAFVSVVGAVMHQWLWQRPLAASIGDAPTTIVLIGTVIVGAWLGFLYEARRRRRRLQGLV
jgi:TIR domain